MPKFRWFWSYIEYKAINSINCRVLVSYTGKTTLETFIFLAYSFQQQRKRHFYVVHRVQNVLFFTITGDKFVIYVSISIYADLNPLQ